MRKIVICLLVCLCFLNNLVLSQQDIPFSNAQVVQSNFSNLIVFARFNDEEEFVNNISYGTTSVKQLIDNSYSNTNYSVKDYYWRVSNGKLNIQNMYLFNDGGSIVLNKNRGYYYEKSDDNLDGYDESEYYTRLNELQQDWTSAIQNIFDNGGQFSNIDGTTTYPASDLDKNNDGYIDCITLIFNYSSAYDGQWKGCLWNYQSTTNRISLATGSKTITSNNYVQISYDYQYSYTNEIGGIRFANLKTMIHEMGHVFGLKDLYNSQNTSPIYYMSAMSNAISPIPQYISAKEREVLGWLDSNNVKKITAVGDYTVEVTSSEIDVGLVAYKCDIPSTSKTLYLEYRKFDGDKNKYDTLSKTTYNQQDEALKNISIKSGLVCFLIDSDTLFPNNMYCNSTNWNYQVIGGSYATKTDSPLAQGDSLDVTSNLSITVKELIDSSLTFNISGTDIATTEEHSHTFLTHEFNDSTCTLDGNIAYKECTSCHKYFTLDDEEITLSETVIVAKGHDETIIPSVEASCTSTGLTQGKKCNRCGEILLEQSVVAKKSHTPSDWIVDTPATEQKEGSRHKECTVCHETLDTGTIPKLEPSTPPTDPTEPTDPDNPPTPPVEPDTSNTKTSNNKDQKQTIVVSIITLVCIVASLIVVVIKLKRKE